MISIGGVIGGGLFVGSGTIIQSTGPAAILSYIIGALMVVLVMRMLGEMGVRKILIAVLSQRMRIKQLGRGQGIRLGGYIGLTGSLLSQLKRCF